MKKSFTLVAAVLAFALVAAAQEAPKFETFLGYSFVRFSSDSGPLVINNGSSFNANGGDIQLGWNFNRWLGVVVDGGAVHHGDIDFLSRGTAVNFVAGPRVSYRKWAHFRPFAQALFGGVYYNQSTMVALLTPGVVPPNGVVVVNPNDIITARINQGQTNFAMIIGGGFDVVLNKHLSVRPIGADWYRTSIKNLLGPDDRRQNNFRYTAGVNFTFGAR